MSVLLLWLFKSLATLMSGYDMMMDLVGVVGVRLEAVNLQKAKEQG